MKLNKHPKANLTKETILDRFPKPVWLFRQFLSELYGNPPLIVGAEAPTPYQHH